jgi:hypothetical protein
VNKTLSIIILTHNQPTLTERCLASLQPVMQAHADYELILIDNGSDTDSEASVTAMMPQINYVHLQKNIGVAAGRNVGIRKAVGKYIMLLDNDTIVTAEAIEALVAKMDADSTIGVCAPKLVLGDGTVQDSYKDFPGVGIKLKNLLRCNTRAITPSGDIEPFYVIGACQIFRRKTLDSVGMLDEKIFYGPEDADFCMRVRKEGLRIVYAPHISIHHYAQRATRHNIFSPLARKHISALLYFYRKHHRIF